MIVDQLLLQGEQALDAALKPLHALAPDLVLAFFSPDFLARHPDFGAQLRRAAPGAVLAGCSTAGEIHNAGVAQGEAVITMVRLRSSRVRGAEATLTGLADSRACGRRLAEPLVAEDLRAVMVFGPGLDINGSALADGMHEVLPAGVAVVGGLAGDDGRFSRTWVLGAQGIAANTVVAVGLYGRSLKVRHAARGGWTAMGPLHRITRSDGNILHELDGVPALDLYKRYLGELADQLPGSGLLFPFELLDDQSSTTGLVRTPLGVDEAARSITLAGAVIESGYLRLMNASMSALIDGAEAAAQHAMPLLEPDAGPSQQLALLVSCVGRRLVLGDLVGVEVDVVKSALGPGTVVNGFHSYGELCPQHDGGRCTLHNQTMTVTTVSED